MLLEVTKVILTQNNLHIGSLNKKIIKTLNIHPAEAQEDIEKEILTLRWGELVLYTNKPNPTFNKKTVNKSIFVMFKLSILCYRFVRQKLSYD
jgi:hypothetical protein